MCIGLFVEFRKYKHDTHHLLFGMKSNYLSIRHSADFDQGNERHIHLPQVYLLLMKSSLGDGHDAKYIICHCGLDVIPIDDRCMISAGIYAWILLYT